MFLIWRQWQYKFKISEYFTEAKARLLDFKYNSVGFMPPMSQESWYQYYSLYKQIVFFQQTCERPNVSHKCIFVLCTCIMISNMYTDLLRLSSKSLVFRQLWFGSCCDYHKIARNFRCYTYNLKTKSINCLLCFFLILKDTVGYYTLIMLNEVIGVCLCSLK